MPPVHLPCELSSREAPAALRPAERGIDKNVGMCYNINTYVTVFIVQPQKVPRMVVAADTGGLYLRALLTVRASGARLTTGKLHKIIFTRGY